jgi:hypothetical protein
LGLGGDAAVMGTVKRRLWTAGVPGPVATRDVGGEAGAFRASDIQVAATFDVACLHHETRERPRRGVASYSARRQQNHRR